MGDLKNKLLKNLHIFLLLWFGYGFYEVFDLHEQTMLRLNNTKRGVQTRIKREEKRLKKLEKFKKNLVQTKQRVISVTEQITQVQRQLPTNVNDTEVLEFLTREAKDLNIRKPNMSPDKEELNGFYFTKNYRLAGVGTYLQFLVFFERIASSERLFNVEELNFMKQGDGQKGRFRTAIMTAKLQAFRYNEAHQERTGIEDIERKFEAQKRGKKRGRGRTRGRK